MGERTWDVPKFAMSGNERIIDWINKLGAMGISHVQVRFASRSAIRPARAAVASVRRAPVIWGQNITRCR